MGGSAWQVEIHSMLRGDVQKLRAVGSLAENPPGRLVTCRAVDHFS